MSKDEQDIKIENQDRRITVVEECINGENGLLAKVNNLIGKQDSTLTIIRYVVIPLILILGGLVGVKIALPTA